jgi:hypothetical protein
VCSALKDGVICLATVIQSSSRTADFSCPEPVHTFRAMFTALTDPKGGVHVHWLFGTLCSFQGA